jgi:signal peptidase I
MTLYKRFSAWMHRPNKSTVAQYVEAFVIILPLAFFIRTFFYGLYQVPTPSMETTMLVGERFLADKLTIWFRPPQRGDIIAFNDPEFDYSDNTIKRLWQCYVWGPQNWTKRVIGIPGDIVKGVVEDGRPVLYLNGKKLDEPYVNKYPILAVYKEGCMPLWTYRSFDPNFSYHDQPFYRMDKYSVESAKKIMQRYGEASILQPFTPKLSPHGRIVDDFEVTLGKNQYWVEGDNRQGSYDARFWGGTGRPLDGSLIHGRIIFRLWSIDSDESWWIVDLLKHPIDFWKRVRWNRFFQRV